MRKKMKQIIVAMMLITLNVNLPFVSNAESGSETGMRVSVSNYETLENASENYYIPKEVLEYVQTAMEENENSTVNIYIPETNARGYNSYWANTRTYKGYRLRDWIVEIENSTGFVNVRKGKTSHLFAEEIVVKCSEGIIDKFAPFTTSLLSIVNALNVVKYPQAGDKTQADIEYTAKTKFTYVTIGGEELLGARTQSSTLETIEWYYYYFQTDGKYKNIVTYNKTFNTPSYSNPDQKAISGTGIGGWLEGEITYKVGDYSFALE